MSADPSVRSDGQTGAVEPRGFSIEVARAYAADRGLEIEWVRFRWPELAGDLALRRFDFALSGVTVRPDRSIAGRFSLPVTTSGAIALVAEDSDWERAEQLNRAGVGIAVNAGGHLERVARRLFPLAEIEAVPRNDQVLPQLGRGVIRAVLTDSLEAPIWQAKRPGLRAIGPLTRDRKAAWFPISRRGAGAGADRVVGESSEIAEIERFDRWLLAAEASGRLARWRAAYGLPETRTARPKEALLASLDERLGLMIDVARAKHTLGSPIEDRAREDRVLDAAIRGVEAAAERLGVSPPKKTLTAPVFEAQIEAAKAIQRRWTGMQRKTASAASEDSIREAREALSERIRPALIALGNRIATLLVVASVREPASGGLAGVTCEELRQALDDHPLPAAELQSLHAALVALASKRSDPNPERCLSP